MLDRETTENRTKGGGEKRIGVHADTTGLTLDGQLPADLGIETTEYSYIG